MVRSAACIVLFSIAFAFVESSVVVYLRDLYYPNGFSFPLTPISSRHILVEIVREFSTIIMLVSAGWLAGHTRWERMAWFMVAFGIWDIFYYVWLKFILDWPATIFDWDILFLIPIPWIGPVVAPAMISVFLIFAGVLILKREAGEPGFHAPTASWWFAAGGSFCILFSFLRDTDATVRFAVPQPYWYWLFFLGLALYAAGMAAAFRRSQDRS